MNMQPSEAEAGYDLRLPPMADPDVIKTRISQEWAPSIRSMTYTVNMNIKFSLLTLIQLYKDMRCPKQSLVETETPLGF